MAKGISDFDQWLQRVKASTDGLPLVPALDRTAELAREAFGARIWFAEILGRRWSHIAGQDCAPSKHAPGGQPRG